MANPDPTCTVKDGASAPVATTNGADVTAGNVIVVALANPAGVDVWQLTAFGQDDLVAPPTPVIDSVAKTATFTAMAAPWALIFKSTVQRGVDVNGVAQQTYSTTFKISTLTAGGLRLGATNETSENSTSFGWLKLLNALIRAGGGGVTLTGDATGPSGSNTVVALTGAAGTLPIASTGAIVQWAIGASSPTLKQANQTANSTNGQDLTIQPQNATGTTSVGGRGIYDTGTGTTRAGDLLLRTGGTAQATFSVANSRIDIPNYALSIGTSPATAGDIRVPAGIRTILASNSNTPGTNITLLAGASNTGGQDTLQVGDATNLFAYSIRASTNGILRAGTHFFQSASAGADWLVIDSTAVHGAVPFAGSSADSRAFTLLVGTQAMGDANQTPAASVYQSPHLVTTGAITANRDCVLPAHAGATYFVDNQCTGAFSVVFKVTGQTGVTVGNGKKAVIKINTAVTDYVRITADQ